ncbi:MAG: hypothetical protein ACM3IH_21770 [Sphingobacteriales bacterium]
MSSTDSTPYSNSVLIAMLLSVGWPPAGGYAKASSVAIRNLQRLINSKFQTTSTALENEFFAQRDQDWFAVQRQKEKTLAEATRRFQPQPYLQLAQTYRTAGYRADMAMRCRDRSSSWLFGPW